MATCKPVGLGNTRILTNYAQKPPWTQTWIHVVIFQLFFVKFRYIPQFPLT